MPSYFRFKTGAGLAVIFLASFCQQAWSQTPPPRSDARREAKVLPPRVAPTEYQSIAKAGKVTIAADFAGHGVPTPDGTFANENYLVFEVGIYGEPGARLNLSYRDFSLRINGKKAPLASQSYEATFGSLKDPEWAPPTQAEPTSKSGINTGGGGGGRGGGGQSDAPPPPPKMPLPMVLAMEQKVKMASIPEGERPLPLAGLIYFQYGGKTSKLSSIELIYEGAAGKASLPLQ